MKFRSILLAEARGSMAGATFSRNGNSAYVRARATPVNPRSPSQTVSRDNLNAVSTAWRSLTQAERNTWIALAPSVPYVNSLGESATYSGFQLFMKCNLTLLGVGQPFTRSAPAGAPTFPSVSVVFAGMEQDGIDFGLFNILFGFTATPGFGDISLVAEATYAFSGGKKFVPKSAYKQIAVVDGATTIAPWNLTAPWEGVFGIPSVSLINSNIAFRFRFVNIVSGFASPWVEFNQRVSEA